MNRGSSMQNGLIDHVTLTFDLLTPKTYHIEYVSRSFHIPSLNTLGSFVFELCCRQTDIGPILHYYLPLLVNKDSHKQTDGLKRATHAD